MTTGAERLYRRLLIVLPGAFRDEAERELVETFRQWESRVAGKGIVARAGFWLRITADLAVTSVAERWGSARHRSVPSTYVDLARHNPARPTSERVYEDLMRTFDDLRLGLRSLVKNRGFAVPAILTLVLGIGSITAIFSVVNAVLIEPLPYRDPSRLVLVWQELRARNVPEFPFPLGDIPDLREKGTVFEEVGTVQTGRQTLGSDLEQPEQVRVAFVTPNMPRLLGVGIAHGRDFTDADATPLPPPPQPSQPPPGSAGQPGSPPTAVTPPPPPPSIATLLSYEFWQRRFGGDPSVVGRQLDFGNARADVIGVLAPNAQILFPPRSNIERTPDLWVAGRVNYATASRAIGAVRVVARMKPGVSLEQAQAQMESLAADLRNTHVIKKNAGVYVNAVSMHDTLVSDVKPAIVALMGAVVFVLLIACANVANLLIAQSVRRERDLAVQTALGAGRGGLIRQMLTESFLLGMIGAAGGLALAQVGIKVLQQIGPTTLPRLQSVSIDARVLAFTLAAALLSVVLFGIFPALRASRPNIVDVLRRGGRNFGLGAGRLRSGLVIVEVALSFVLLIGSGLMLRSMIALQRVNPGFDPNGVLTFFMPNTRQQETEARAAFMERVQAELAALPGVLGVSGANPLPLDGGTSNMPWGTEAMRSDPAQFQQAQTHSVQVGYFETMRAPILEGRSFTREDNVFDSRVVIIDRALASKAFPGESAIGKRLLTRVGNVEPTVLTIIGVVAHQRHASLGSDGREAMFFPDGRNGFGTANRWVVRTSGDPMALAEPVKAAIARIDPRVAISDVQPMSVYVDRAQAPTRFALVLTSVFAAIAAVLAVIGLYGVLSASVRQRTAEIGVRMAFGAERTAIFRLVVGRGLLLALIGMTVGIAAALGLTRYIGSLLVGVGASDPATFTAIAMLFLAVSAFACGLPAYRAARLDPTTALRAE